MVRTFVGIRSLTADWAEATLQTTPPPAVSRVCYLAGGLVALNNPGTVVSISAGLNSRVLASFENSKFGALFAKLGRLNLTVLGCEFFQDKDEVGGLWPAEFRTFDRSKGWLSADARQQWRQLATSAMQVDAMGIADIASRVAFEIAAAEYRILELSRAYGTQLRSLVERAKVKDSSRFNDLNSGAVVHCAHAVFFELAILRDYLAEFLAKVVFKVEGAGEEITTMAQLRNSLPKETADELVQYIFEITNRENRGWLSVLSAYRNLFTHVAPMELAGKRSFAIQQTAVLTTGGRLPVLYHPLPSDALGILKERRKGFPYKHFQDWAMASAEHKPARETEPDALEYLHGVGNKMFDLALRIVRRSPIAPKMLELGPGDIIGPVTVERS